MKTTYEWEKILHRVPDREPEWWWASPSVREMNQVYNQTPPEISAYEAVVEVVRLRQAIERRARLWGRVAVKLSQEGDMEGAHNMSLMTRQLMDILNGVTDE